MQDSMVHHAWAWAKEQSAWGDKVLNWHITPDMREAQYSGVQSASATGILNRSPSSPSHSEGVSSQKNSML